MPCVEPTSRGDKVNGDDRPPQPRSVFRSAVHLPPLATNGGSKGTEATDVPDGTII